MSVGSNPSAAVDCLPEPADNSKEVLICHEKRWWFWFTRLEYVLDLARFRVFVPKLYYIIYIITCSFDIFRSIFTKRLIKMVAFALKFRCQYGSMRMSHIYYKIGGNLQETVRKT